MKHTKFFAFVTAVFVAVPAFSVAATIDVRQPVEPDVYPQSFGAIIGDSLEGPITGYGSLFTVFDKDENGNLYALARTDFYFDENAFSFDLNKYRYYDYSTYRCGDTDGTGLFNGAKPYGVFKNYPDLTVFKISPRAELKYTKTIDVSQVKNGTYKAYARQFYNGSQFMYYNVNVKNDSAVLSSDKAFILDYSSEYFYNEPWSGEYFAPQTEFLAPVYDDNQRLFGFVLNSSEIISVTLLKKCMRENEFTIIEQPELEPYDYDNSYNDFDYGSYLKNYRNRIIRNFFAAIAYFVKILNLIK